MVDEIESLIGKGRFSWTLVLIQVAFVSKQLRGPPSSESFSEESAAKGQKAAGDWNYQPEE